MKIDLNVIFGNSMFFSFASIIMITFAYILIGVTNDYILYDFQEIADELHNQSIIKDNAQQFLQQTGDSYTNMNFHIDDIWFILYLIFVISSFIVAYRVEKYDFFSYLGMTFYGIMVLLFIVFIVSTLNTWWKEEILLKLFPNVNLVLPKFYFYLDNLGIFVALQIVICMFINMVDFNFAKIKLKRKQEERALSDNEVV